MFRIEGKDRGRGNTPFPAFSVGLPHWLTKLVHVDTRNTKSVVIEGDGIVQVAQQDMRNLYSSQRELDRLCWHGVKLVRKWSLLIEGTLESRV